MPRLFAFLRAINVGGHTVRMEVLKSLFEECGFRGVETFLASGNVVFDSPLGDNEKTTQNIEAYLKNKLGYPVTIFLRNSEELSSITNYQPFPDSNSASLYIAFLSVVPDSKVRDKLYSFITNDNQFDIHDREVYWLCRTRFSDSTFTGAHPEKTLGMQATIRNITTLQKMVNKYIQP